MRGVGTATARTPVTAGLVGFWVLSRVLKQMKKSRQEALAGVAQWVEHGL